MKDVQCEETYRKLIDQIANKSLTHPIFTTSNEVHQIDSSSDEGENDGSYTEGSDMEDMLEGLRNQKIIKYRDSDFSIAEEDITKDLTELPEEHGTPKDSLVWWMWNMETQTMDHQRTRVTSAGRASRDSPI
uniref:Uncharacterized protein n=1 Tax=Lutzomyia longipalpis TaxID=7200 RepID=A0A1B0CS43_LUTLO